MSKKSNIVIIGGGVAGLSAGIYGQINGFDCEIIEMHTIPGGQCTAWDRKGFRFDYCVHWLVGTAKGPFHDVWYETGALSDSVEIIDHEIHTKIYMENGEEFIIYTNLDKWEKYLRDIAPEDTDSIARMCSDMRKASKLEPFWDPPGLRKLGDYLKALPKVAPFMMLMMKYGKLDCAEYFEKMNFKSPRLKSYLNSYFGSIDFSAIAFLFMLAWFNQKNAGYPVGGSLPLATRMADKFESLGGKMTLGRRVDSIIVENDTAKGVILSDRTEIRADYVVAASDGYSAIFKMLQGRYLSKEHKHAYENWKLFTPIVQVSFGLDTVVQNGSPVTTYLSKGLNIGSTHLKTGYSIMNYSFDKTMAPEGKSVVVMRFESPWEFWEQLDHAAYRSEKDRIEKDAVRLLEKYSPGIASHIEVTDVATPRTDVRYTGVWKGSYEGFLPAKENITKTLPMTLPGLSRFYQIGQWITPGGGLPPAGQSGRWAIQKICRGEGKKFQTA